MLIAEIFLKDFRNFDELSLTFDEPINIFLGLNAQGKTNILEAIHFASLGKSRASRDAELIRWDSASALVRLKFSRTDISHELAIELQVDRRRRILFDANSIRPRDLIGKLNSVLFSPEDLFMFKGSPAGRRRFLDAEIAQASPIYFADLSTYNRLIDQRNNLLKKIREGLDTPASLDLWTEQLAKSAAAVTIKRLNSVYKLNLLANLMQRKISTQAENLSVKYSMHNLNGEDRLTLKRIGLNLEETKLLNAEDLKESLKAWYHETFKSREFLDIKRGSTSLGPHLDDLQFFVNGRELRAFGSQGQLRTATLALKLSELQFLKSETGEYPILLLDDVMSELDFERREQLLNFLLRERIQTLITATDRAYFPPKIPVKFFQVEAGRVTSSKGA